MLTTNVHPKLGRIVATTKPDKGLSVTAGEFSVLMSDGFFSTNVDETRNNGMRNTKRFGELRFYVTEEDAMEESAYLVGKREDELPGVTTARRARSDDGRRHGVTWRRDVARRVPHRAWEHVLDGCANEKVQRVARARGTAGEAAAYR